MAEKVSSVELQDFNEEPREDAGTQPILAEIAKRLNATLEIKAELRYPKGFLNAKETLQPTELSVTGTLPTWLKGELFTVGPGIFDVKYNKMIQVGHAEYESGTATFSLGHWFDALPLVNRFAFDGEDNKIVYRSRHTAKKCEAKIRDRHGIVTTHPFSLYKTHTNQTPLAKIIGKKRPTKPDQESCNASINVHYPLNVAGEKPKVFCQNSANQVVELDANDLTPIRLYSWNELNPLFKGEHAAPHSYYDSTTGELINFTMEYHALGTKYNFFSVSEKHPGGDLITTITSKSSYVHSFAVTPRFVILVLFPYYIKNAGLSFRWADNILDSFVFRPEEATLFYVISRAKKQHVATYKSDACFALHNINAFEDDDDNIYIDLACYPDDKILQYLTLENIRMGYLSGLPLAEIRRFSLQNIQLESIKFTNHPQASQREVLQNVMVNLFRSRGTQEQQSPLPFPVAEYVQCSDSYMELPRINPRNLRNRYRFVYGIGLSEKAGKREGQIWDALVKSDLETKEAVAMWCEDNCYPSEPIFVPVPGKDSDEDDGVLLSIVYDGMNDKSFLIILEAKTMQKVAAADLPEVIPLSFGHGAYKEAPQES